MAGKVVDLILVYQFLKRLTTPFDQTEAFKLGLIDKDGKKLKSAETPEEKQAMGYFDRLVFNLKRLLGKVPGGKSRLASYAAALLLLRESANPKGQYTESELAEGLMENLDMLDKTSLKKLNEMLNEEAPANVTGTGVVGTGDDPVHWDARKKSVKAFLRRYTVGKMKREALKKRKDFMKQLGL
jgi:hypothetical protein